MKKEKDSKIYFPDHVKEHIYKQIDSCYEKWKEIRKEEKEMLKNGPLNEDDRKYIQDKKNKLYRKKRYYEKLTERFDS